ncbi:ABC transporter substrate-binding protein [Bifidobacterium goeldii]|uniref:ABC transporter substrate-binding protein n=1 Tax=Bifidobacterium goeldii TaxID=2306975 RepID=A0A430FNK3_9BIFI|nr:sugar ABC transporter substrate-binding protein [Bifidobacterium goeldii]RSX54401.1 ABC transporter substrate-binding protein [Bifidobacterium goeldii]
MRVFTKATALVATSALLLGVSACGQSASTGESADAKQTVTVWAWEPTVKKAVQGFESKHPNITVNVVNAGSSNDEYTALSNALTAGKGAPDLVQLDFNAVPQFAISDGLEELSQYGFSKKMLADYTKGAQSGISVNNGIYGVPIGGGPMALFYNKEIFDKAGVTEAPKTWDDYYEAAKKIHALGPDYYITNESGSDAGMALSLIWQAGGHPFSVKGKDITINLTSDPGVKHYVDLWQKLIDEKLIDTKTQGWTDDWYRGLGNGHIASLAIGGWMPITLQTSSAEASGKFRAAPLPVWSDSDTASAENGGGALSVVKGSAHAAAAYEFAKYVGYGEGEKTLTDNGIVPDLTRTLSSDEYLNQPKEYFGGQEINKVLAQSAKNVTSEFQFLPYQVYGGSIYPDNISTAFTDPGSKTLAQGLADWQSALVKYGEEQGYTVTTK